VSQTVFANYLNVTPNLVSKAAFLHAPSSRSFFSAHYGVHERGIADSFLLSKPLEPSRLEDSY